MPWCFRLRPLFPLVREGVTGRLRMRRRHCGHRRQPGPGFWEDWLGELRRAGLISELLAGGVIAKAVAGAGHGHKLDRALTAQVTAMCVITGALFPDQG